jgi:nitrogen regulatory protein P-II 2
MDERSMMSRRNPAREEDGMTHGTVTCMVIVAESVLEQGLLRDLSSCGALGWTITAGRGHGPRNRRMSELEGGNIRVETLVSASVATRIWDVLEERYFTSYAIAAWQYEVVVARAERYTG